MATLPLGSYGFSIAIYAISVMIAVSGLFLGLGYATNNKKFKDFGKDELYQSVINGILVSSMLLLFSSNGIVSQIITSATLQNNTSINCISALQSNPAICLAYNYLVGPNSYTFLGTTHSSILTSVATLITALFGLNAILGVISAAQMNLAFLTISFSSVLNPVLAEIQYIIKLLSTVAISAVVQSSILIFVAVGALTVILPVGLILRSFYPTRRLGGFLMALSIGLYVVLPLSYVLNATLASAYSSNIDSSSLNSVTLTASNLQNRITSITNPINANQGIGIFRSLSALITSLSSGLSSMVNSLLSIVAYFIVSSFVLPAFSLIITGISVREFAELLGSEAFFGKFDIL